MRRRSILLLALVATSAFPADPRDIAKRLGVGPGQVSSIRFTMSGRPFEVVPIPTPSTQLATVYPDLEFFVLKSSRRIAGVGSARAYAGKVACESAGEAVRRLLRPAFPAKYTGPDPRWQFQSDDGGTTAGTFCETAATYPVLRLDVTHTATNDALLQHFTRRPANNTVEGNARKRGVRPSP